VGRGRNPSPFRSVPSHALADLTEESALRSSMGSVRAKVPLPVEREETTKRLVSLQTLHRLRIVARIEVAKQLPHLDGETLDLSHNSVVFEFFHVCIIPQKGLGVKKKREKISPSRSSCPRTDPRSANRGRHPRSASPHRSRSRRPRRGPFRQKRRGCKSSAQATRRVRFRFPCVYYTRLRRSRQGVS
jgi:hypothetical protein